MCIDRSRLLGLVLAGLFAGLVIFFFFNPGMAAEEKRDFEYHRSLSEEAPAESAAEALLIMAVFSGAFAAMLGGTMALADEIYSPPKRIAIRMGIAVGTGLLVGGISGLASQALFATMGRNVILLIPARIIAWATFGLGAGAGLGIALGSLRRALMCMLGGFIGGCIGGGLFDAICLVTGIASVVTHPNEPPTGTVARLIGFSVMGIAVGATVAFVEDIAKRSWITVLNGPKEGRSFILSKATTTIGRDELADIPLFGDARVTKQHAALLMQGNVVTLQATGGPVAVNGAAAQMTVLRPWDTISVGRWSLRFHQKGSQPQAAYFGQPLPDLTSAACQPNYAPQNVTMSQPAVRTATGSLALVVVAGPHLNQRFSFGPGAVRIGREVGCGVLLAQDSVVSRNHAELTWNGSAWVVRDLGSRNGLWVNGVQVTEHTLNVGDQIGVGQTWLKVEGL